MKIAVFASGGGSNFQALIDAQKSGNLDAEFVLLLTNNSKCGAVERAQKNGISVLHISSKTHPSEEMFTCAMLEELADVGAELIVLAGYMKKIPSAVIEKFKNRILNIHPSLLPSFGGHGCYGIHVHEAVLEYGAKITGATVHLVSGEYDTGAIVLQDSLVVLPTDTPETLQKRVLEIEHRIYPLAVQAFAQNRIEINQRAVWVRP
jgi:phosphoribosylglycinamide formyltransferase 1